MSFWQWALLAAVGAALVYAVPYLAARGWGDAFFARKARHNREVLRDLERSMADGPENKE